MEPLSAYGLLTSWTVWLDPGWDYMASSTAQEVLQILGGKFPQTDLKSHYLRMNIVKLHTASDRKLGWGWECRLKYSVEQRLYTGPV